MATIRPSDNQNPIEAGFPQIRAALEELRDRGRNGVCCEEDFRQAFHSYEPARKIVLINALLLAGHPIFADKKGAPMRTALFTILNTWPGVPLQVAIDITTAAATPDVRIPQRRNEFENLLGRGVSRLCTIFGEKSVWLKIAPEKEIYTNGPDHPPIVSRCVRLLFA